jgi:tRNA(fMet)-specific endonuclease VapC
MFLLDTDIVSLLQAGNEVLQRNVESSKEAVVTSVVTQAEVLRARFDFLLKASDRTQLMTAQTWIDASIEFFGRYTIMPMSSAATLLFERIREQRGMRRIGRADLLIACIALSQNATVVTRNVRHFQQVPGLKIVDWSR